MFYKVSTQFLNICLIIYIPVHEVTSIKQSPVFKGHLFLSCHSKFHMN